MAYARRSPTIERDVFITPDGEEYVLHAPPKRIVTLQDGYGTPPIEYITQRGPLQHGDTVKDLFLRPRSIQFGIRHNFCSRAEYWDGREGLLAAIRPNRAGTIAGVLRKYLANGEIRDLAVMIESGPGFVPAEDVQWDEWAFTEILRFTAYDPTFYSPVEESFEFRPTGIVTDLTFPITFPISFSSYGVAFPVTYAGTWIAYPTIRVDGPITGLQFTNVTTDEQLILDYALPAANYATFDLRYGVKSVTRDDGVNLIPYLTPESDLATFHLEPDPGAPGGINEMTIFGTDTTAATRVLLTWNRRYFGI